MGGSVGGVGGLGPLASYPGSLIKRVMFGGEEESLVHFRGKRKKKADKVNCVTGVHLQYYGI